MNEILFKIRIRYIIITAMLIILIILNSIAGMNLIDYLIFVFIYIVFSIYNIIFYIRIRKLCNIIGKSEILYYSLEHLIIFKDKIYLCKYNTIIESKDIKSCFIEGIITKKIVIVTNKKIYKINMTPFFSEWNYITYRLNTKKNMNDILDNLNYVIKTNN